MILQSAKQICVDENYLKIQELTIKEEGTTSKLSCKYEVFKEYPADLMVSTQQVVN